MYTAYFGLRDNPFAITPDPSYLYLSPHHQEALAHLLYGAGENGGFVQLTGEVGTGKTTLIRTLLEQQLEDVDVALCLNPSLTVHELVATICDELHVDYPRETSSLKLLYDALNAHLLNTHAQGRRTILIIDEAQSLDRPVLEQIRLLTNLETHRHKLLRIILVGQPELQRLLERQDMRQLAQRITARYHLMPLNRQQTTTYIQHRLQVAGGRGDVFTSAALRSVYRLSQGVPRLINVLCNHALLGAYGQGRQRIDKAVLRKAAKEVLGVPGPHGKQGLGISALTWAIILLGIGLAGVGSYLSYSALTADSSPEAASSTVVETPKITAPPTIAVVNEPVAPIVAPAPPAKFDSVTAEQPISIPQMTSPAALQTVLANAPVADSPLQQLLALWGEDLSAVNDQTDCETIKAYRLYCLEGQGADWSELRRYNRPVLLQLNDGQAGGQQLLLRTLTGDSATVQIGEQAIKTTPDALAPLWNGNYRLLWRPQIVPNLISPGSQGESVVWLRRQLALAQGRSVTPDTLSTIFDPPLQAQVRDFQRANNLEVDGLVGQRTMALLNTLSSGPDTPVLTPSAKVQ
ncbi:MAG: AAA family ATPase [Candidatus Competibacteraceae bacterium]|jgi:general secretion pathway protein A|nr:AAA family ATPase [Candidatus Competibacteraceae bacterium]